MTKYANEIASAAADITDAGAVVTFTTQGTNTYDPVSGSWSGTGAVVQTTQAVQVQGDPDRFAALGLVLVDPVTLLVAAQDLVTAPLPGNAMAWAGTTYTVKDVDAVAPDGTGIIYTVTGSK